VNYLLKAMSRKNRSAIMRCLWLCDKNFARVADLTFMRNSHDEMGCDEIPSALTYCS
jgi:hypothetical protein